ncbi:MAG: MBL fold metallo-hydrolase [Thermodesulfobacteriota bacterium]
MQLQLIRNATMRITYSGKLILTDPFLLPAYSFEPFVGVSPNPTVELPCSPPEVVDGVELVIVSHLHPDHIDPLAQRLLPGDIPLFCQPGDEMTLRQGGFQSASPVDMPEKWEGITISRTPGRHGTGAMARQMGSVSGFTFQAEGEPTVYWAGDTIWYEGVKRVLEHMKPDVIVTHSCGAQFPGADPIIMDAAQTIAVCREAPEATVVAIHMEAVDHATVTRAGLREAAEEAGITPEQLLIPQDGETLEFLKGSGFAEEGEVSVSPFKQPT